MLACLGGTAFYVSHVGTPRDAWSPFSFPIDFNSKKRVRAEFHPRRTAAHLVVLDLGCPTASAEESLLEPDASTLPFSWQVLTEEEHKVVAAGRLGVVRRAFAGPSLEDRRGQEVGRFQANVEQSYEILIDVGEVTALGSCNPRFLVPLVPDAYVGDAVTARLMHMAGSILGVSSILCFFIALVKRVRKDASKA